MFWTTSDVLPQSSFIKGPAGDWISKFLFRHVLGLQICENSQFFFDVWCIQGALSSAEIVWGSNKVGFLPGQLPPAIWFSPINNSLMHSSLIDTRETFSQSPFNCKLKCSHNKRVKSVGCIVELVAISDTLGESKYIYNLFIVSTAQKTVSPFKSTVLLITHKMKSKTSIVTDNY